MRGVLVIVVLLAAWCLATAAPASAQAGVCYGESNSEYGYSYETCSVGGVVICSASTDAYFTQRQCDVAGVASCRSIDGLGNKDRGCDVAGLAGCENVDDNGNAPNYRRGRDCKLVLPNGTTVYCGNIDSGTQYVTDTDKGCRVTKPDGTTLVDCSKSTHAFYDYSEKSRCTAGRIGISCEKYNSFYDGPGLRYCTIGQEGGPRCTVAVDESGTVPTVVQGASGCSGVLRAARRTRTRR
jgi:hypothetical protein